MADDLSKRVPVPIKIILFQKELQEWLMPHFCWRSRLNCPWPIDTIILNKISTIMMTTSIPVMLVSLIMIMVINVPSH